MSDEHSSKIPDDNSGTVLYDQMPKEDAEAAERADAYMLEQFNENYGDAKGDEIPDFVRVAFIAGVRDAFIAGFLAAKNRK